MSSRFACGSHDKSRGNMAARSASPARHHREGASVDPASRDRLSLGARSRRPPILNEGRIALLSIHPVYRALSSPAPSALNFAVARSRSTSAGCSFMRRSRSRVCSDGSSSMRSSPNRRPYSGGSAETWDRSIAVRSIGISLALAWLTRSSSAELTSSGNLWRSRRPVSSALRNSRSTSAVRSSTGWRQASAHRYRDLG